MLIPNAAQDSMQFSLLARRRHGGRSSTGCGYASPRPIPGGTRSSSCCRGEVAADRGTDVPAVLAEQLLALVAEQCAVRPTILVVDDLQWADQASVTLWGRLARSARQVPLLLVGMMRPAIQRDDLLALRRVVDDDARLQLTGLTGVAVADPVAALAGGKARRQPLAARRRGGGVSASADPGGAVRRHASGGPRCVRSSPRRRGRLDNLEAAVSPSSARTRRPLMQAAQAGRPLLVSRRGRFMN